MNYMRNIHKFIYPIVYSGLHEEHTPTRWSQPSQTQTSDNQYFLWSSLPCGMHLVVVQPFSDRTRIWLWLYYCQGLPPEWLIKCDDGLEVIFRSMVWYTGYGWVDTWWVARAHVYHWKEKDWWIPWMMRNHMDTLHQTTPCSSCWWK